MYSFDDIKGNANLIRMLKKSVEQQKTAHAYIFDGPEGCGKKLIAHCFAKYLFCSTKEAGCTCHSCVQFDSGNHSDTVFLGLAEKAKSISIAQVREEIIKGLNKKPFEYEHKVYIIDRAELMTTEAQNALLRSLEEPPPYAIFILLSRNASQLLQTIRSRCIFCRILPLGQEVVREELIRRDLPPEQATIAAACSAGSIGKAMAICSDEAFHEMRRQLNQALAALRDKHDLMQTIEQLSALETYKDRPEDLLNLVLLWFRDVLAYKATKNTDLIAQQDYLFPLTDSAEKLGFLDLYQKLQCFQEFRRALAANTPFATAADALAVKLG